MKKLSTGFSKWWKFLRWFYEYRRLTSCSEILMNMNAVMMSTKTNFGFQDTAMSLSKKHQAMEEKLPTVRYWTSPHLVIIDPSISRVVLKQPSRYSMASIRKQLNICSPEVITKSLWLTTRWLTCYPKQTEISSLDSEQIENINKASVKKLARHSSVTMPAHG